MFTSKRAKGSTPAMSTGSVLFKSDRVRSPPFPLSTIAETEGS